MCSFRTSTSCEVVVPNKVLLISDTKENSWRLDRELLFRIGVCGISVLKLLIVRSQIVAVSACNLLI